VDEAALVRVADSCGHADGEAQETLDIHRHAEEPAEQLAAGILEHQNGPAAIAHKLQRPHRPRAFQLILEGIFVGNAIESGWRGLFRGREYDQDILAAKSCALTPASAED
jgi:hypothetical protein